MEPGRYETVIAQLEKKNIKAEEPKVETIPWEKKKPQQKPKSKKTS